VPRINGNLQAGKGSTVSVIFDAGHRARTQRIWRIFLLPSRYDLLDPIGGLKRAKSVAAPPKGHVMAPEPNGTRFASRKPEDFD